MQKYTSWGRFPQARQQVLRPAWVDDLDSQRKGDRLLPFGNGRSYGDSCLNDGGTLIDMRGLNRFIAFDRFNGVLQCEAGVMLADILRLCIPQGWFLPVTPGTQFVTIGGAIGNDVHGKNHHIAGSFGCHVRRFALWRSSGEILECSPKKHADLFEASIGGLGLTGVILWAEIQMIQIRSPFIVGESIKFHDLSEFLALSRESEKSYAYTVAWIDCVSRGVAGRGLFSRGNHAGSLLAMAPAIRERRSRRVPFDFPGCALNALSVRAFNLVYFHQQIRRRVAFISHYDPFFYPLDSLLEWNRIYGKRGFFQYQCVVEDEDGAVIAELLRQISRSGQGSFLAVLKSFGTIRSPGLLSFPRPGLTLALDFPNGGSKTFALLNRLDEVVAAANGAVYPAKDARMSGATFRRSFPQWEEFYRSVDPCFSSSFWRRVMGLSPEK